MAKKTKTKNTKWIILGIIAIFALGAAGALWMGPASEEYESVEAKVSDITTYYSFSGNVEAKNREAMIAEKIMQISEIKVKEGDIVEGEDVLLKTTAGDEIQAKISGEIVNMNVEENAQVMGGTKLLEIVDYNNLQINIRVDEYDIGAIEKGKEAVVKIGAIDKEFKGTISKISKEGQVANGVTFFTATIDIERDQNIKIGMSAEVKLISAQAKEVVTVPMTAIQFDENNKPYVLKKDENETVIKAKITTGINDGTSVEVKSGVLNGETIFYTKDTAIEDRRFPRRGGIND